MLINCFPQKHEDLSFIPKTHTFKKKKEKRGYMIFSTEETDREFLKPTRNLPAYSK